MMLAKVKVLYYNYSIFAHGRLFRGRCMCVFAGFLCFLQAEISFSPILAVIVCEGYVLMYYREYIYTLNKFEAIISNITM